MDCIDIAIIRKCHNDDLKLALLKCSLNWGDNKNERDILIPVADSAGQTNDQEAWSYAYNKNRAESVKIFSPNSESIKKYIDIYSKNATKYLS